MLEIRYFLLFSVSRREEFRFQNFTFQVSSGQHYRKYASKRCQRASSIFHSKKWKWNVHSLNYPTNFNFVVNFISCTGFYFQISCFLSRSFGTEWRQIVFENRIAKFCNWTHAEFYWVRFWKSLWCPRGTYAVELEGSFCKSAVWCLQKASSILILLVEERCNGKYLHENFQVRPGNLEKVVLKFAKKYWASIEVSQQSMVSFIFYYF